MTNPTDTNQASEDELERKIEQCFIKNNMCDCGDEHTSLSLDETEFFDVEAVVKDIKQLIRTEKLKLLNELDKSMPTAEQLTTKYGYHMPDKQYGYKLALHDIREVLTKLEAEL